MWLYSQRKHNPLSVAKVKFRHDINENMRELEPILSKSEYTDFMKVGCSGAGNSVDIN